MEKFACIHYRGTIALVLIYSNMNIKSWIRRNCRFAKRQKLASVSLYVQDHSAPKEAKDIHSLSWDIAEKLFPVMQNKLPPEVFAQWRQNSGSDFFTIDGFETQATEGLLNFYVPYLKMEHIQKLLPTIFYYAQEFGSKMGQPIYETFGQKLQTLKEQDDADQLAHMSERFKGRENELRVVRFPVKILPKENADEPPDLNFSNMNFTFLFQDVLNFPLSNMEPPWSFMAADLLMKISTARSMIQSRIQEENQERDQMMTKEKGKVNVIVSPVDEEYVDNALDRIASIAQWALNHNYFSIEAG
jgi:hypothetical protein